ncbi:GNAT family N-acetyltransferase [Novosphingobium album (ex Liu et al. 2023)]|uniref:GNAT family N-acetyltransferase n=1 Tax=Novosphingobium album (ex Liu et al. 2023) TaxID=3031130 RepID=A0ABT5WM16_9SPHN|nr:GNAT family N-acetyltransferase [Novosphingobium album (ex Liu et al. 2023)]MDE8651077.1 GNAT family N-acetyltransferase [Novosphingobium album (ex Liu et al. 2023)]
MTGPAIQLRPATPDDAAAVAALGRDAFCAAFAHLYAPHDLASFLQIAHTEANVAREIADPAMCIQLAERDGALLGFCKLAMACGWPDHARGKRAIELKQIYLDPARTGGGVGARLMDWAIGQARGSGADEIQLSVWSGNHGAQRFYARYGFIKMADIEFWVGRQCDAEFLFAALI